MRNLLLFESYLDECVNLKDFVSQNIKYLLDDGVLVHVLKRESSLHLLINYSNKSWEEVSYDIVPLLIRLYEEYYFGRIDGGIYKTKSVPNIKIAGRLYNYFDIVKGREITETIGSGTLTLYLRTKKS